MTSLHVPFRERYANKFFNEPLSQLVKELHSGHGYPIRETLTIINKCFPAQLVLFAKALNIIGRRGEVEQFVLRNQPFFTRMLHDYMEDRFENQVMKRMFGFFCTPSQKITQRSSDHEDDKDEDGSKEEHYLHGWNHFAIYQLRTRIQLAVTLSQTDMMQFIAMNILAGVQDAPQPITSADDERFARMHATSKVKVRLRSDWKPMIVHSIETSIVTIVGENGTVEEMKFSDYLARTWPLITEYFWRTVREVISSLRASRIQEDGPRAKSLRVSYTALDPKEAIMKIAFVCEDSGLEILDRFEVEITARPEIVVDLAQAWACMTTALRYAPEGQAGAYYVTPNVEIIPGTDDIACVVNVTQTHLPDYRPPESQRWQPRMAAINPVAVLGFPVRR